MSKLCKGDVQRSILRDRLQYCQENPLLEALSTSWVIRSFNDWLNSILKSDNGVTPSLMQAIENELEASATYSLPIKLPAEPARRLCRDILGHMVIDTVADIITTLAPRQITLLSTRKDLVFEILGHPYAGQSVRFEVPMTEVDPGVLYEILRKI